MTTEQKQQKTLNAGQQAACDGFFSFLFTDQKELIISGAGGVGKTFLMGYLIDEIMPRYYDTCSLMNIDPKYHSVEMTATTNKAAEVLGEATNRPTSTVHSFLGLRVKENFSTGRTELIRTRNWKMEEGIILFVDECSMIDIALRKELLASTFNCKIVYVGDHSQLPPVFEELSPIYRDNLPFFELTEPMRNADHPELMEVCQQLRETVATGIFKPIKAIPGVIDWLDAEQTESAIMDHFVNQETDSRILAYSNVQVNDLNQYIRTARQLPAEFTVGEHLISNSAVQLGTSGGFAVEEAVTILRIASEPELIDIGNAQFYARRMDLEGAYKKTFFDVLVPEDKAHFDQLCKYFAGQKDWVSYFKLKNNYPDLRPRDVCTVHKSQGSTYDTVFIDMENLSKCTQPKVAARLLYVAFTRARHRVIMYGNLAKRLGGIIE